MTALLVTCGALAREVLALRQRHGWDADVQALPAELHNRPAKIPEAVKRRVEANGQDYHPVIVVYGDCGTGGELHKMLEAHGWMGLAAPHCYALYAGKRPFERMMSDEPGTFFLTDYLAGSFDHLVTEALGLDRYPELRDVYFGRYQRVVYLQQRLDPRLLERARQAARALSLPLEVRHTGLLGLERELLRLLRGARATEASIARSDDEPAMTGRRR